MNDASVPTPYTFVGDGKSSVLELLLQSYLVNSQSPSAVNTMFTDSGDAYVTSIGGEPGEAGWMYGILRWNATWAGNPWPEAVDYHLETPMSPANRYVPEAGERIWFFPAPKLTPPY